MRWRVINWVSISYLFFVKYKYLTFCLFFTFPQWMESSTKEKEAKCNAWNVIHATNLLFCCTQTCNLFLICLVLDCHELCFNTEVSNFPRGGSLISISRFVLPNEKHAYSLCRCWGSLGLSPHLQAPKAGYEGSLSTSNQLSPPQTSLVQPSSQTSFTVRAAVIPDGSSVCQDMLGLEVKLNWLSAIHKPRGTTSPARLKEKLLVPPKPALVPLVSRWLPVLSPPTQPNGWDSSTSL